MSKSERKPRTSNALKRSSEAQSRVTRSLKTADALANLQVGLSLKSPFAPSDPEANAIMEASFASYSEFAPADATERILATLSTGLTNAAMTSLQHAAHTTLLPARSEELENATQAAQVVMELLEARDRHRGRGKQTVAVGQVTVESGGQAIVGTVNSEASFKPANTEKAAKETPSQENTAIPRGTRKVG